MDSAIQPNLRYGSAKPLAYLKRTREMREIEIRFLVFSSSHRTGPYAYLEPAAGEQDAAYGRPDNYISANTELDLTRQKGLSSPTS